MSSKSRFHFCHGGLVELSFPHGYKMAARVPGSSWSYNNVLRKKREAALVVSFYQTENSFLVASQLMSPQLSLTGLCSKSLAKLVGGKGFSLIGVGH